MAVLESDLLVILLGGAALFWVLVLLMKENNIAKGKRSDFSSADRKKVFLALGLSVLVIPVAFAGLWIEGWLAYWGFGKTLLSSLGVWLKETFGLVTLFGGIAALMLHKKNEEMLLRSDAQEQNKTDESNNNRTESDDGGGI